MSLSFSQRVEAVVYENILLRFFLYFVFSIFKALFIQLSLLILFDTSYPHLKKKTNITTLIGYPKGQRNINNKFSSRV